MMNPKAGPCASVKDAPSVVSLLVSLTESGCPSMVISIENAIPRMNTDRSSRFERRPGIRFRIRSLRQE